MTTEVVISPILPKDWNNLMKRKGAKIESELEKTLRGPIKERIKQAMTKRTSGWTGVPEFAGRYSNFQGAAGSMYVFPRGPNADKWRWVSGGTPPRIIRAVNKPNLVFPRDYTPHTKSGNHYGGPGRRSGPIIIKPSVHNPGIDAREFEKHIKNEEEGKVLALLSAAIKRALI